MDWSWRAGYRILEAMRPRLRRWLLRSVLIAAVLVLVAGTTALVMLPRLVRQVAIWRLQALTHRSVSIDALDLSLRTGRFSVRGVRVNDPDGGLLAGFDALEGRVHRRSFLEARVWIENAVLTNPRVRVVRVGPDRFNISDLLEPRKPSRGVAITVDHFAVHGGSLAVEDRVLTPALTWHAESIEVEAHDLTTSGRRGTVVASTTLAGALVTVRVRDLQLLPVHLHADVNIRDLDLTLADLYLPPDAVVEVESGLLSAALGIDHDDRDGLALNAEGIVETLAVGRRDVAGDEFTSPEVSFLVRELRRRGDAVALRYASLEGDVTVLDPTTSPATPLAFKDVTVTASGLEQPMKAPAQVAIHATLPGVGELEIGGAAGVNPRRADVRLRARSVDLGFFARHLPFAAHVDGVGTADVRVVARQDPAFGVTVTGDAVLDKVALGEGGHTPLSARRVTARGLTYTYPATVRVNDLTLTEPSAVVERAADGTLNLAALARRRDAPAPAGGSVPTPAVDVAVTRLSVVHGHASVSDAASGGRMDAAAIELSAEDVTWPARGPARVRLSAGIAGGQLGVRGTVDTGPRRTELTLAARGVDLAALQPWLPPAAGRVRGAADADVTLALALQPLRVEANGHVSATSLAWSDGVRPTVNVSRLDLRAQDVTWPSRGLARVQLATEVAGGRINARGTVDAGARRAELAIKASGVDLAAAQPWLPIVGQVRGAADADVTVAVGLQPFSLEAHGAVGAGDLAFLDGTRPLITVKRVDARGIDLAWPTRLAIDRLRVNTPWAEVARTPQGELSLRAIFRRRPDRPAPAPPTMATASPGEPPAAGSGPLPGMQLMLRDALFENGGARIIDDAVEPAARFEVAGSRLELRNLSWPSRGPSVIRLATPMPGSGTLTAQGTFTVEPTRLVLDANLDQVDLAPGRPYLPFDARIAGKLTGRAKINGTFGDSMRLVVEGDAAVSRLRLGDPERRLVTAEAIEMAGFRYVYPTGVRVRQITLAKPWMLIERQSDGTLELVTLFRAKRPVPSPPARPAPGAAPLPRQTGAPAPGGRPLAPAHVWVVVDTLVMHDGFVRFVDRTTSPPYAEELSAITFTGESLGTTPTRAGAAPRHGTVALRGMFASGTPLVLRGTVGSYPGPLFLDVTVDVTDFPIPRLNPYLDRLSSWVARQGTLTATLTYHVEGDDLEAVNRVEVNGLQLDRGGHGNEFTRHTGLPLGTLVSLLKDRKGVIKLTIPVSGRLSSPEFEYGEAVWAALRNLTIRLVALPFSLVGKLFFTEDSRIESVQIDPVTFQVARATPDKDGAEQLDHLAAFLRETPEIRLRLRPVTTVADVTALRRQALESRLAAGGGDEAARRQAAIGLYAELFPRREPPTSDQALYEELTRETPTPPRALRALATERVAVVRDALVRGGIAPERLEPLESRTAVESEGAARVEFEVSQQ
jgi:uncharacterized protein DUF748